MAETKLNILPVPTFASSGVNFVRRETGEFSLTKIDVAKNDVQTLVQYITDSTETAVTVADNGRLELVQVFDSREKCEAKLDITLGDNASGKLTQVYIGGDTVSEIVTKLVGYGSQFDTKIGYQLDGSDTLDINLVAEHSGRKSISEIAVNGVQNGSSSKTFKGTIDFKNGAVGAVGGEKEDVILMNDKVRSRTVPVILCAEEDVVGNHGATVGRIDEHHIFYMKSRGIPEDKIYEMAARAKLTSVINCIADTDAKERIAKALGWEVGGDDDEQ